MDVGGHLATDGGFYCLLISETKLHAAVSLIIMDLVASSTLQS